MVEVFSNMEIDSRLTHGQFSVTHGPKRLPFALGHNAITIIILRFGRNSNSDGDGGTGGGGDDAVLCQ